MEMCLTDGCAVLRCIQDDFAAALDVAQTALEPHVFDAAWAAGRSLSLQAAMTWGLQAIHTSDLQVVGSPD